MAFIQCNFHSDVLGMASAINVILPQQADTQIGMASHAAAGELPVLYLLHGLSDDHTIWHRRTSIERYAAPFPLAVVMPNVHRSFYTDMAEGHRYFTFVTEELPAVVHNLFRVSTRREDTFVAGLSMGGYGAFRLALARPDRYAFAASLSGALDIAGVAEKIGPERGDEFLAELRRVFGPLDRLAGSPHDLFRLASELAASDTPPPGLYLTCGTDDYLYPGNVAFRDHLRALGLPFRYDETPGGHTWDLWDAAIQTVLALLPLPPADAAE
jgi:S-formylglutathione hydrolase FrmB